MKRIGTRAPFGQAGRLAAMTVVAAGLLTACQSGDPTTGAATPDGTAHKTQYSSLRDRVKQGDMSVDFTELRFAYTLTPQFDGTGAATLKQLDRLNDTAREQMDGEWLVDEANRQADRHFADIGWHVMLAALYQQLEQPVLSRFHTRVLLELLRSIEQSGDGLSIETAFTVISVQEMQWFMRLRGLDPYDTELVKRNGHTVARVRVSLPDTPYGTGLVYFNLDAPAEEIESLQRALEEANRPARDGRGKSL